MTLWGHADGKKVTVTPSWGGEPAVASVDRNGKWSLRLQTPAAGGPYEITFDDGTPTQVRNILIGEVWLCSGQSNMSMPMNGFSGQPIEGALDIIMDATPSVPIRMCMVGRKASVTPEEDCKVTWKENTPGAASVQGAVSYMFALRIQKALGVPVGIINTSWGGSKIEAWIDRSTMEKEWPETKIPAEVPEKGPHQQPTLLYNGMVAPLAPFTAKGIIWYQGESNRSNAKDYARLTASYVGAMRRIWDADLAFYAVQIAPYRYGDPKGPVFLMEAQEKALDIVPHSGLARTLDLGDYYTIHPPRKREVATRLAALALQHEYGMKGLTADAPRFNTMTVEDGKVTLSFHLNGSHLGPISKQLEGFELAGADKVFHPATTAVVTKDKKGVIVRCKEVPEPVAVRYAFHNYATASLFNDLNIPVGPFRSDDWE